ncbi:hypothetical protein Q3G72_015165 [Acer saccharum]|nr:hypothetical protein Q3G72_015165 [Acer saccharum]
MLFISLDQIKFIWTKFACTRMSCKDAPSECSSLEGPLLAHLNELELAFVRANSRVGLENHSGDIEMYQMDNQSSRGLNLIKDVFKVGACDDNSDKISKEEEFLPVPNSEKEEEIGNGVSHGMMTSISKSNGHPSVLKEKEDLRVVSTKSSNLEEEAALIIQTGESLGFKREKFAQKAGSMFFGLWAVGVSCGLLGCFAAVLVVLPFGSVWTVAGGGGDVLCVFSSVIVDGTSAAAELAAILQACKCCASAMCPTNLSVIIESDSSSVVSWVNSVEGVGHIRFSDTILEIREILFRLKPKVLVRFVNRGNNAAADFLAKQGAINGLVQLVWSA